MTSQENEDFEMLLFSCIMVQKTNLSQRDFANYPHIFDFVSLFFGKNTQEWGTERPQGSPSEGARGTRLSAEKS